MPATEDPSPVLMRRRALLALLTEQQHLPPVQLDAATSRGVVRGVNVRHDRPQGFGVAYLGMFLVRLVVGPVPLQLGELRLCPRQLLPQLEDAPFLAGDGRDEIVRVNRRQQRRCVEGSRRVGSHVG